MKWISTKKMLSISEAARDLANWLKQAVAGEEIGIRSDNTVVALRPLPSDGAAPAESLAPREALRRLHQEACLTPAQAESNLQEVHSVRLGGSEFRLQAVRAA